MALDIVSIGSSSSGNSYIIQTDGHVLILDVGLTCRSIMDALRSLGKEPEDVDAVLITHEHSDHIRSVRAIARKCRNAKVVASMGTAENTENFIHVPEERQMLVSAGEVIEMGPLVIKVFPLSHDAAEPTGFTVETGGEKLAVVTDTGVVTEEIYGAIHDADMLVFEANHDVDMLMFGMYPYPLKVRIKSDNGHLSNECAAEVLTSILAERKERFAGEPCEGGSAYKPLRIMLAHLSFNNNMPIFASQTVEDAFEAAGFSKGTDYLLEVAAREGLTSMPGLYDDQRQC